MQAIRNNPMFAVGLLVLALVALFLSWFFFMRPTQPNVEPVQPPQTAPNPEGGQGQLL